MALPSSGTLSIDDIRTELGSTSGSLRTLSAAAGKSIPDAISEFYGYSSFTPASNFAPVTYTGSQPSQSITVGFQPDLIWIKDHTDNEQYSITDSVSGLTKYLDSASAAIEATDTTRVTSVNSNGFVVGSSTLVNQGTKSYIAWCWKASNSTSTNTDGNITSTVSANTAAGFSIVNYTGSGATSDTVGHGLGASPEMIIWKNRDQNSNTLGYWAVQYNSQGAYLNRSDVIFSTSLSSAWGGTVTSSTFEVKRGSYGFTNNQTDNITAYCFRSISGYSKINEYTGNGSSTGPTITLGFAPRFLMIKGIDVNFTEWVVIDNARDTGANPLDKALRLNSSSPQITLGAIDFLSNGFQIKTTDFYFNQLNKKYLYYAIA